MRVAELDDGHAGDGPLRVGGFAILVEKPRREWRGNPARGGELIRIAGIPALLVRDIGAQEQPRVFGHANQAADFDLFIPLIVRAGSRITVFGIDKPAIDPDRAALGFERGHDPVAGAANGGGVDGDFEVMLKAAGEAHAQVFVLVAVEG